MKVNGINRIGIGEKRADLPILIRADDMVLTASKPAPGRHVGKEGSQLALERPFRQPVEDAMPQTAQI
jgi:hypothetical protein